MSTPPPEHLRMAVILRKIADTLASPQTIKVSGNLTVRVAQGQVEVSSDLVLSNPKLLGAPLNLLEADQ